jgi:hypothetical protein
MSRLAKALHCNHIPYYYRNAPLKFNVHITYLRSWFVEFQTVVSNDVNAWWSEACGVYQSQAAPFGTAVVVSLRCRHLSNTLKRCLSIRLVIPGAPKSGWPDQQSSECGRWCTPITMITPTTAVILLCKYQTNCSRLQVGSAVHTYSFHMQWIGMSPRRRPDWKNPEGLHC